MRLRSLDAFRGATVAAMLVVNNPGDWGAVYWPLLHAAWHGWTPTDLVFPFFLFIVGAAIPLGRGDQQRWQRIWRRTALIVGVGWLLAAFPWFRLDSLRLPGVLPRIGLCYLAAASLLRVAGREPRSLGRAAALGSTVLLVGYWALLTLVPVPGGSAGDLAPGKDLGAWLDRALMSGHLWREDWDPEGLLSTMPAVATTLIGVLAGLVLRESQSPRAAVRQLSVAGLAGVVAGLAWSAVLPINKPLWTSSYALFTAGVAAAALAACYAAVDGLPTRWATALSEPFVALGRNALLAFVLSGLIARTLIVVPGPSGASTLGGWLFTSVFAPLAPPKLASLLFALAHLALLWALLWVLHRRKRYWSL